VAAVFVMNILYVDYEFFMLLVALLLIPLVTSVIFLISTTGLRIYMNLSNEMITVGDKVSLRMVMANKRFVFMGNQVATLAVHYVNEEVKKGIYQQVDSAVMRTNTKMALAGKSKYEEIPLEFGHCGMVELHMKNVKIQDLIGILSVKKYFDGNNNAFVMPKLLYSSKLRSVGEIEHKKTEIIGEDTDVVDLRDFMAGDHLNHIHWNLSLRTEDDIIVRQLGDTKVSRKVILVDMTVEKGENCLDMLDKIYTFTYSLGNLYLENGYSGVILVWNEKDLCTENYEFDDADGLFEALKRLFSLKVSDKAGEPLMSEFVRQDIYEKKGAAFVTVQTVYSEVAEVFNVAENDMQKMLDDLWERV
jgi:uncharacterized protein (DUF58 family)